MPNYVIRNQSFRDTVLTVPYPFDAFFREELDELYIGNDVFLDAHFYFKSPVTLPISLTVIDGTYGEENEIKLIFTDADNKNAGVCVFASGDTKANVYNDAGLNIGILVLDSLGAGRLVTNAQGRYFNIVPGEATLHIDTCKVYRTSFIRYIHTDNQAAWGAVNIIARHGVQWTLDDNVLSLDVLGEDPSLVDSSQGQIKSVNGVTSKHIWLNATPEANLRIKTNKALIFQQAKDITS
jgi:hypothetical protein